MGGMFSVPPPTEDDKRAVYSVEKLTREIKLILESGLGRLWVEGEISNFLKARSGHWYFTLKDDRAQLSCVIFRSAAARVSRVPKEGDQVLLKGRINVYEPRGQYQFIADSLQDRGVGLLRERFEELKRKLQAEGLFETERKRPLPYLPRRIALATSPEGAAVRDMIRVIRRRNAGISIVVIPTRVQGKEAPMEIVEAIRRADGLPDTDLLIVGRGGGSVEDLWAFNDEHVARAIFECSLPVISAVGHEIDFTIADFVADVRAATPSVAGEIAAPEREALRGALDDRAGRLRLAVRQNLTSGKLALQRLSARMLTPEKRLAGYRLSLDREAQRLTRAWTHILATQSRRLDDLDERLEAHHPARALQEKRHAFVLLSGRLRTAAPQRLRNTADRLKDQERRLLATHPGRRLERLKGRLSLSSERLSRSLPHLVQDRKNRLFTLSRELDALSPLNVLDRGYSIAVDERERPVKSARQVSVGERLHLFLARGKLLVNVERTIDDDKT